MALYIGGTKYKLLLDGAMYNMNIHTTTPITNGIRLLTSDDFILKDINGLYLTAIEYINSLSSDGHVLKDAENKYLTIKKG